MPRKALWELNGRLVRRVRRVRRVGWSKVYLAALPMDRYLAASKS